MKSTRFQNTIAVGLVLFSGVAAQVTCAANDQLPKDVDATAKAEFAKLSPSDRVIAEAQRWCPVTPDRLGAMGPPVKIMLEGKVVFLCCADCEKDARGNPKATLGKADKLKKINTAFSKLSVADRQIAEAQHFCAVQDKNDLGSMGTPIKLMLEGQPVFLCCGGCKKSAMANPKATLATVAKLKAVNAKGHEHGDHK